MADQDEWVLVPENIPFNGDDFELMPDPSELPELAVGLAAGSIPNGLTTLAAMRSTFDEKQRRGIINTMIPGAKITPGPEDAYTIVEIPDQNTGQFTPYVINNPGFSMEDVGSFAGQALAFSPGGRIAGALAQTPAQLIRAVALTEGLTQGALSGVSKAAGGGATPGTIAGEVVGTAVLAGGMTKGMQVLGEFMPGIFARAKDATGKITSTARKTIQDTARKFGFDPAEFTDEAIDEMSRKVEIRNDIPLSQQTTPSQAVRENIGQEFGIDQTLGQRTQDPVQLSLEEQARRGALGAKTQRDIGAFDDVQTEQAKAAVTERIVPELNPSGQAPIAQARDAGRSVSEGVIHNERIRSEAVQGLYDIPTNASLLPEKTSSFFTAVRNGARRQGWDATLKSTDKALKRLDDESLQLLGRPRGDAARANEAPKALHINRINNFRKHLRTLANSAENSTDRAQVNNMIFALDDYRDQAVINHLFQGDVASVSALTKANSAFKEYAQAFRERTRFTSSNRRIPDKEGQFIEKIVARNPSDDEVINTLFGSSKMINNSTGGKLALRFKQILGENSPQWEDIRTAGFRRFLQTKIVNGVEVIDGKSSLEALDQASLSSAGKVSKEAPGVTDVLFSRAEMEKFRRFFESVITVQPKLISGSQIPQSLIDRMVSITNRIGPVTALRSPSLFVSTQGIGVGNRFSKARAVESAIRPFEQHIDKVVRPSIIAATTSGGKQLFEGSDVDLSEDIPQVFSALEETNEKTREKKR